MRRLTLFFFLVIGCGSVNSTVDAPPNADGPPTADGPPAADGGPTVDAPVPVVDGAGECVLGTGVLGTCRL
jgi:hypothetical protein